MKTYKLREIKEICANCKGDCSNIEIERDCVFVDGINKNGDKNCFIADSLMKTRELDLVPANWSDEDCKHHDSFTK